MKKCNNTGKRAFESRREAYENSQRGLNGVPYECKCGKYHLRRSKKLR